MCAKIFLIDNITFLKKKKFVYSQLGYKPHGLYQPDNIVLQYIDSIWY